jgi:hydrogenase maturation factor
MNLLYGELVAVFSGQGMRLGRIRVGGALKTVPLELLTNATPGDRVLLCDGVAISKVAAAAAVVEQKLEGPPNVSGHPR